MNVVHAPLRHMLCTMPAPHLVAHDGSMKIISVNEPEKIFTVFFCSQ